MTKSFLSFATLVVLLAACGKKEEHSDSKSAPPPSPPAASAAAAHDASAGSPKVGAAQTFVGKYVTTAGTLYIPTEKDFSSAKFKNDESKMLGEGALKMTVEPTGRVTGESEGGPLGAAVLEGNVADGTMTAQVRRKDPADQGLTGTMVAKVAGDKVDGAMKLAESNASVVRTATVTAARSAN